MAGSRTGGLERKAGPQALDYLRAAVIRLPPGRTWQGIVLIGCGGTGGWLAPAIARIAYVLGKRGERIKLAFVDPDQVEEVNIGRQNFCPAEIGRNKAEALALRYGTAWGIEIEAIPERWNGDCSAGDEPLMLVGCVDNAAARKSIARQIAFGWKWWLDCGNGKDNGQVLLGNSCGKVEKEKDIFPSRKICIALPAPHIQERTLLVPRPEEEKESHLSCAELAARNAQSLAVNQRTAAEAADMLVRLMVTFDLKRYATYFDLCAGTAVSKYATVENVAPVLLARTRRKKGEVDDQPDA